MSLLLSLLVLLLFSSMCSLALSRSVVTHLPGFEGTLPFRLETGYVTVDEVNDAQLFYYFIESEGNPNKDPILLWLTGGPGCSAFCGLAFEIGPLKFRIVEYNGSLPTLVYAPHSWTKFASIIFLDSPVGTGFSFSRHSEGYEIGDVTSSKHATKFLRKWYSEHPQFLAVPLYIGGDSYAGKVVPVIAQMILEGNEAGLQPFLNLQGYLAGNPRTRDSKYDHSSRVPHAHGLGIISDEIYESTRENCGGNYADSPNTECAMSLDVVNQFLSELNLPNILEPNCRLASPKPKDKIGEKRSLKEEKVEFIIPPAEPSIHCRTYVHYLSYYWANSKEVMEALHIQKGTVDEWLRCNHNSSYLQDISSNIEYHMNVTAKGYRALVYSGDHDMAIPFLGTHAWIKSLNFSVVDDWRSWKVGGQVAGYTKTYSNNLTFATVKGAGHTAPEYRPKECLAMFGRWISHKPL